MSDSPLAPHSASPAELKERLEAERSGVAFLVYRDEEKRQRIEPLDAESRKVTIGRDAGSSICMDWDPEISGIHAELEWTVAGWVIADEGLSRNGTFMNGERLQGRRRLRDGDMLRFGKTAVIYKSPRQIATTTTVASGTQAAVANLSQTQRQVLIALCRPFKNAAAFATPATNQAIAGELFLSVDAVKTHMRLLFQKFGVEDLPQNQKRARLVELAFHSGLISERDL